MLLRAIAAAVTLAVVVCAPAAAGPQVGSASWGGRRGPSKVEVTEKGSLRVNGEPFFPIFAWNVPRSQVKFNHDLGINAITPGEKPEKEGPRTALLDDLEAHGMMLMVDAREYSPEIARHPALLCWKFGDEPDMRNITPEDIRPQYEAIRRKDPSHPTWTNLTARFYGHYHEGYRRKNECPDRETYRGYGRYSELVSFDHYPVTGWNRPDRVAEIYHATKDLVSLYPRNVCMAIVEDADQDLSWTPRETRGATPEETRAMVWMAIVAGAKGIGYFHIAFNPFRWHNLTPEMKKELPRLNAQITRFAAPLLEGRTVDVKVSSDDVAVRSLKYKGRTYVFAVNLTRERREVKIAARGATFSGTVDGEDRKVRASRGAFSDAFGPLAVHVYVF